MSDSAPAVLPDSLAAAREAVRVIATGKDTEHQFYAARATIDPRDLSRAAPTRQFRLDSEQVDVWEPGHGWTTVLTGFDFYGTPNEDAVRAAYVVIHAYLPAFEREF